MMIGKGARSSMWRCT